eukprot:TRINITY_DN55739_c0_g1_i1.p1 TRINITY_DN55739_c0_g1~~TRINITY_DN55739_c0_g1_i1.p1  ORF type:complete len:438 (-),score=46.18 TRINITY_DN55739_c0_g1_i1:380-1636(-)
MAAMGAHVQNVARFEIGSTDNVSQDERDQSPSKALGYLPTLLESRPFRSSRDATRASKPKMEIVIAETTEPDMLESEVSDNVETAEAPSLLRRPGFQVRNTFIDICSPSSERLKHRAVNSCPGKHVGLLRRSMDMLTQPEGVPECMTPTEYSSEVVVPAACAAPQRPVLSLVDALGADSSSIPNTPEPFSMNRCYTRDASCEMAQIRCNGLPFIPSSRLSAPSISSAQESLPGTSGLDWSQNTYAHNCQRPSTFAPHNSGQEYGATRSRLHHAVPHAQNASSAEAHASAQSRCQMPSEIAMQHVFAPESGLARELAAQRCLILTSSSAPAAAPALMAFAGFNQASMPHPPPPSQPAPGSLEMPSIGSAGHAFRECKPCAFLYTKGCENGAMCKFCHLCDAGEKKKRQKEKKLARRGGA